MIPAQPFLRGVQSVPNVPRRPSAAPSDDRSVSPVIGAVVLVAITVLLAAVGAVFFLGLTDQTQPVPEVRFDFEYSAGTDAVTIAVEAGAPLDDANTGRLVLVVDGANGEARRTLAAPGGVIDLTDEEFGAGESVTVDDASGPATGDVTLPFDLTAGDELSLVWTAPGDGSNTATLTTDTVPSLTGGTSPYGPLDRDDAVVTLPEGVAGDGGAAIDTGPDGAQALGNTGDVDGDGRVELPYVDADGDLVVTDSDGETATLVDASAVPDGQVPRAEKTRLATGRWQGGSTAVFYANADEDAIYRVAPGESPTVVVSGDPDGDGVDSVHGPGDIDGDGTEELVYADASQTLAAVEPDGTGGEIVSIGSSRGIGSGPLHGFGSGERAVVVDTSNDVALVGDSGVVARPAESAVSAAKSPLTVADVDGDGAPEIVYIDASTSTLRYIDDVGGSPTVQTLTGDDGDPVGGDEDVGVVS